MDEDHVIWLRGDWVLVVATVWLALALAISFIGHDDRYGPADRMAASLGGAVVSALLLTGIAWVINCLTGYELGFTS